MLYEVITERDPCRHAGSFWLPELVVGIVRDPVFGPVISFGAGGAVVELRRTRTVALPPLNDFIIEDLIKRARVEPLLGTFRNLPPIRREALKDVLQRVSEMACELPELVSVEIDPLVATDRGVVAIDGRIMVDVHTPPLDPYGHMAIHPYPAHMTETWQLADGTDVTLRPIRPEDAEIEHEFVYNLPQQSKYFRFLQNLKGLTREMLVRFTQIDYDREIVITSYSIHYTKLYECIHRRWILTGIWPSTPTPRI